MNLLLIGAGGFARETAEAVRAVNAARADLEPARLPRRQTGTHGTVGQRARPCSARSSVVHDHPDAAARALYRAPRQLRQPAADSPSASALPDDATRRSSTRPRRGRELAVGRRESVLLAHVDLTADVVVGRHVAVMPQVVLTHDVRVDDFATITSGVRSAALAASDRGLRRRGVRMREGISIGERAMVGMGAVVTRDVPAERLWYGAPARDAVARRLPKRPDGAQKNPAAPSVARAWTPICARALVPASSSPVGRASSARTSPSASPAAPTWCCSTASGATRSPRPTSRRSRTSRSSRATSATRTLVLEDRPRRRRGAAPSRHRRRVELLQGAGDHAAREHRRHGQRRRRGRRRRCPPPRLPLHQRGPRARGPRRDRGVAVRDRPVVGSPLVQEDTWIPTQPSSAGWRSFWG